MRSAKPAPRPTDAEWLQWLIERIAPLGRGQRVETYEVPGHPPTLKEIRTPPGPWPFKTREKIGRFRADLGRFAAQYAPHIIPRSQSGPWMPSYDTTQRVLERLPGVYGWAKDAAPQMLSGQIVMYLGKDVNGQPSLGCLTDKAFDIVRAFALLAGRYIGRFRNCASPRCAKVFIARRRDQHFCKSTCGGRERVATHRMRQRQDPQLKRTLPRGLART